MGLMWFGLISVEKTGTPQKAIGTHRNPEPTESVDFTEGPNPELIKNYFFNLFKRIQFNPTE